MLTSLYAGTIRTNLVADASSFIKVLFPDEVVFGREGNQEISDFWWNFTIAHPTAWKDLLQRLCNPIVRTTWQGSSMR